MATPVEREAAASRAPTVVVAPRMDREPAQPEREQRERARRERARRERARRERVQPERAQPERVASPAEPEPVRAAVWPAEREPEPPARARPVPGATPDVWSLLVRATCTHAATAST